MLDSPEPSLRWEIRQKGRSARTRRRKRRRRRSSCRWRAEFRDSSTRIITPVEAVHLDHRRTVTERLIALLEAGVMTKLIKATEDEGYADTGHQKPVFDPKSKPSHGRSWLMPAY